MPTVIARTKEHCVPPFVDHRINAANRTLRHDVQPVANGLVKAGIEIDLDLIGYIYPTVLHSAPSLMSKSPKLLLRISVRLLPISSI
jgi:hypothetical protein